MRKLSFLLVLFIVILSTSVSAVYSDIFWGDLSNPNDGSLTLKQGESALFTYDSLTITGPFYGAYNNLVLSVTVYDLAGKNGPYALAINPSSGFGSVTGSKNFLASYPVGSYELRLLTIDEGDAGRTHTDKIYLTITSNNHPPIFTPTNQVVNERSSFSYALPVSDPDGDQITCSDLQLKSGTLKNLPNWLTLDGCTLKTTSVAPEVANDMVYDVSLQVKDSKGLTTSGAFTVTIKQVNRNPTISIQNQNVGENQVTSIPITISDPDQDAVDDDLSNLYCTLITNNLPAGLVFDGSIQDGDGCKISGTTPVVSQTTTYNNIQVKVTDPSGAVASATFSITLSDNSKAPHADFTWTPNTPYYTSVVQFTDNSNDNDDNGNIVAYNWNFGDGTTSTSKNPSKTFAAPATYAVSLTVTDNDGLTSTKTKNIVVVCHAGLSVSLTASPVSGYAPLENVKLTCKASGGDVPYTYKIIFGDGTPSVTSTLIATEYVVVHTYATVGSYTPECVVTPKYGAAASAKATVTVNKLKVGPQANFYWDAPLARYVNAPVIFKDASSDADGSIVSYYWQLDGKTYSTKDITHTFTKNKDYQITLTVTDNDGLTNSITKTITIQKHPITKVTVTATPSEGYAPLNDVKLTCTVTGGDAPYNYAWEFDDGSFAFTQTTYKSFAVAGDYTPQCIVTDSLGESADAYTTVHVKKPVPVNLPPQIGDIADQIVNEKITYNQQLTVWDPDDAYETLTCELRKAPAGFTINGCANIVGITPEQAPNTNTPYDMEVYVVDPHGASYTEYYVLRVFDVPIPNIAPIALFDWTPTSPKATEEVTFDASASYDTDGSIVKYEWDLNGDDVFEVAISAKTTKKSFASAGTYKITLRVTDDDGATNTKTKYLTIGYNDHDFTGIVVKANPQSGTAPLSVQFSCEVSGGDAPFTYAWTFGDGATANLQNPSHTYSTVGSFTATCSVTDVDGDHISGSVTVTTMQKELKLFFEEFGCNPDVVQGHEEYCSVHIVDENHADVANVKATINYIDPANVKNVLFGSCTTDNKGYCHVVKNVDYEPGRYTVRATGSKQGYIAPLPAEDNFNVWAEQYKVMGLEVFSDKHFKVPEDTFYRSEDMYVSFVIYDEFAQDYTCDKTLINDVFLRVNNEYPLRLYEITDQNWIASIEQILKDFFNNLLGNEVTCTYKYYLERIPLTDDYLGEGKVFAFTFNFKDATAGQATKDIVVLNNPVSLNLPAEFIISKYKVSDSGSVTIDVKEYVADVETAPGNMLYTANMQYNTMEGLATIANTGTGVYTITAGANIISPITFTATVDDTDGSTATDSAKIKIIISFVPRPPVAKFTWSPASPVTKESVLFDASSSSDSDGTITSYAWDFGNGLTATGVTPSHVFAAKGSYNVKLTITDNDGLASSITKIITIAEKENPLFFDEMGCNPDVVQGHEEYCSVHVTNEQGDNVENVAVTFTYTDPSSVASVHFGFCTTDNKGYCHDDLIVNYSPGLYTVTATASKQDYLAPAPKSDTFKVWAERYAINDLKVFSDAAFKVEEDTFYRSEDMYVSFTIYDMFEQKNVCDDSVVREAFLRVNNADPLKLVEITQRTNVEALGNDLKNVIGGACEYKFVLSKIPLSDDYLGSGKVFAFSFNFEDNTAGQATKTVTVLNNPLSFGLPAEFIIAKYVATDKGSITIDLKQYVSDVETLAADMIFTLTTSESSITIEKSSNNNGIYIVSALEGKTGEFTVFASADDTDGSKVTGTTLVRITVDFTPQLPVAIAGPDKTTTVKKSVSVDGSASYDPDGGNIVSYVWNFGNGMTKEGALASMIYQQKGTYTVTLTVTDDEGATASDTLLVTVDPEPYVAACNDGRDNDGDGLIDLKDPGCEDAHDPSEFNTGSSGPEHGLSLVSISTHGEYGFETAVPGDIIAVEVVLANENDEDLEDLRVGFSVPDMGIKQKSSQFTLKDGRQKTVSFEVYLPYDVPLGEYYTEITVANDDIRRSTHRVLHIIAG